MGRKRRRALDDLAKANEAALDARPAQDQTRQFSPISEHSESLRALKSQHRYSGYVEVEIDGASPFVMFLNDDDQIAYVYFWYGRDAFETLSLRLWTRLAKSSDVILDIGAFTGVYTLAAATSNKKASVHSFEPVGLAFSRFLTNLTANRLGKKAPGSPGRRVAASNMAVGDHDGEAQIKQFRNELTLGTGASLVEKSGKEVTRSENVRQVTIDKYAQECGLDKIDLIKADVEQAELMILDGMSEVLEQSRPDLMIEVSSEQNLEALAERLEPYGYNFVLIGDQEQSCSINSVSDFSRVCNVLFCATPEDRLREFCDSVEPITGTEGNSDRQRTLGPSNLDEQLSEQVRKNESLEAELQVVNRKSASLEEELRVVNRKSKRLETELQAIKDSTSWKLAKKIITWMKTIRNFAPPSRRT